MTRGPWPTRLCPTLWRGCVPRAVWVGTRRLFGLDNLATLMARTNRTLLVLGGEGTAEVRDSDTSLGDLVHAAVSRIERYPRVEQRTIDGGVEIRRDAVDDLVHLLAELLDNATSYSPPDSPVFVDARLLGDRVL